MANKSNEYNVGLYNGNVVKARSVVRVVASKRWSADIIEKVAGVPGAMHVNDSDDITATIEDQLDPHANREAVCHAR